MLASTTSRIGRCVADGVVKVRERGMSQESLFAEHLVRRTGLSGDNVVSVRADTGSPSSMVCSTRYTRSRGLRCLGPSGSISTVPCWSVRRCIRPRGWSTTESKSG